jgi:hypothetical protein
VITFSGKVQREARMEPPLHTAYFHSGAVITLTGTVGGKGEANDFLLENALDIQGALSYDQKG